MRNWDKWISRKLTEKYMKQSKQNYKHFQLVNLHEMRFGKHKSFQCISAVLFFFFRTNCTGFVEIFVGGRQQLPRPKTHVCVCVFSREITELEFLRCDCWIAYEIFRSNVRTLFQHTSHVEIEISIRALTWRRVVWARHRIHFEYD